MAQGTEKRTENSYEERKQIRQRNAGKPRAIVINPETNLTTILSQIVTQLNLQYRDLSNNSGPFGSIPDTKKAELDKELIETILRLDQVAEKITHTLPGRRKYFTPRELRPHVKQRNKTEKTQTKTKTGKKQETKVATKPATGKVELKPANKIAIKTAIKTAKNPVKKVATKPSETVPASVPKETVDATV